MLRSFNSTFKETLIMNSSKLLATVFVAMLASAAQAQPVMRDGTLADATGRTLYTFDKDTQDKSNCAGGCLAAWPAFVAKPAAVAQGDFGLIESNGVRQWTVKGKPLYFFAGDVKAGDRNGDGSGGVWHVVGQANKGADKQAAATLGYSY
jgi:predicted lipoprotein with Yx(FWY)xxD motif